MFFACTSSKQKVLNQEIITSDVTNFWKAFDAIQTTNDSTQQMIYLQDLFLNKASAGQKKMMEARRYSAEEYLNAIKRFPQFWNSLRANTNNIEQHSDDLLSGIEKLNKLYPISDPAAVYFTMGVFRSPGTGMDSFALIGTEYALGDSTTNTTELSEHQQNYFKINPIEHLQILMVHEYVHTQQKPMVHNLLCQTIYEGVAEFVAQIATGKETPHKAFKYGPAHAEKVVELFERDMFRAYARFNWLWNNTNNEFGTSDMGYYVGHSMAKNYYETSSDKQEAIKDLVELDYEDTETLHQFVDNTKLLSKPVKQLEQEFEEARPFVSQLLPFENGSRGVDPRTKAITIQFSEPLDGRSTSIDYGPLEAESFPEMSRDRTWADDFNSWTIPVKLFPNKHYQFMVGENFRNENGDPLRPFLVEFYTGK